MVAQLTPKDMVDAVFHGKEYPKLPTGVREILSDYLTQLRLMVQHGNSRALYDALEGYWLMRKRTSNPEVHQKYLKTAVKWLSYSIIAAWCGVVNIEFVTVFGQ